jgi:hypoxanthine phosphoribosyltransferase
MTKRDVPVLLSAEEIRQRLAAMAREIATKLPPDLLVASLLKGSFIFAADLIRMLHEAGAQTEIDFMTLQSYGADTQSSGEVRLHSAMQQEAAGRNLLLLDDILESGRTLHHARTLLQESKAATVHIAVLLEKPGKRACDVQADFVGFQIPDRFVVGYGLDYANRYRALPYIGVLEMDEGLIPPCSTGVRT